jgi:hypothetical protein
VGAGGGESCENGRYFLVENIEILKIDFLWEICKFIVKTIPNFNKNRAFLG